MKHLITVAMAASCLGIAVPGAGAQTVKDLVGTWALESDTNTTPDGRTVQPFGPNPQGTATHPVCRRARMPADSDAGRMTWTQNG